MTLSRSIACGASLALMGLAFTACGSTPSTRTVSNSDTTTQTASGGETHTTVHETNELAANGSHTTQRTETVQSTAPAPVSGHP